MEGDIWNPHTNAVKFTHDKQMQFQLSVFVFDENCKLFYICGFLLHLFKTRNICVCIRNTFVNLFLFYIWIFVCIEKYFCGESHWYLNQVIHLWILLCAFYNIETQLISYKFNNWIVDQLNCRSDKTNKLWEIVLILFWCF